MRYCPNLLHQSSKAGIQTDARFVHYTVGADFKSARGHLPQRKRPRAEQSLAPTVHLYYITVLGRPDPLYALGRDEPPMAVPRPRQNRLERASVAFCSRLVYSAGVKYFAAPFPCSFQTGYSMPAAWRCQASASGHSSGAFSISGAVSPPGSFWPKDGTKKYLRMMKISAMAPTLTRFCTASSWPTIIWRAMA